MQPRLKSKMPRKEWPIAKLPVTMNPPSRPISILLATILILFILLLLISHDPDEFHVAKLPNKQTKLCILPKKGNLRLPKNYRGICLLDDASKVIRKMTISPQTTCYR